MTSLLDCCTSNLYSILQLWRHHWKQLWRRQAGQQFKKIMTSWLWWYRSQEVFGVEVNTNNLLSLPLLPSLLHSPPSSPNAHTPDRGRRGRSSPLLICFLSSRYLPFPPSLHTTPPPSFYLATTVVIWQDDSRYSRVLLSWFAFPEWFMSIDIYLCSSLYWGLTVAQKNAALLLFVCWNGVPVWLIEQVT